LLRFEFRGGVRLQNIVLRLASQRAVDSAKRVVIAVVGQVVETTVHDDIARHVRRRRCG
jgi:hypothetical protein